ncbi:MAG: lipopolysaccharide kinase InaA family protein [Planctomycetota bacterium]
MSVRPAEGARGESLDRTECIPYIFLPLETLFRALFGGPAIETRTIRQEDGFEFYINTAFDQAADSLLASLDGLAARSDVTVKKKNMVRTVFRVKEEGVPLYVKAYHSPGVLEAVKSLIRPSRAACEWRAMCRLEAAGVPTATPVLYGERRKAGFLKGAFFAATEIEGAASFGDFYKDARASNRWTEGMREQVYDHLARLTARLHEARIRHGDFHLGNILLSAKEGEEPQVHVIDLHSVSFPARLSRADRILNLARVAEVLSLLNDGSDLDLFLEKYLLHASDLDTRFAALRLEVKARKRRLMLRRMKSRTRRCLLTSTEFTPARQEGFRMLLRRVFPPQDILKAIRTHQTVKKEGDPRLLHPVFKNKVTRIEMEGESGTLDLCVKEYRPRSPMLRLLGRFSEARKSWVAGRGLEVRAIDTPQTAAWVRGEGREFLITRFVEGRRLHDYVTRKCDGLDRYEEAILQRRIAEELADYVKKLHASGVRHGDLSEQNILVHEEGEARRYFLIDCDTLTFLEGVKRKTVVKNLIQLGHMPENASVMAKARFLSCYLGPAERGVLRALLCEVNEGILARMKRKRLKFERLGLPDPHPRPSRMKGTW